jgi:hypothetical protein
MMFYTFNQNNSGGSFDFDPQAGVSHFVIVEADSDLDALSRAEDIGLYFDGIEKGYDCECCGDRWYQPYEADQTPQVYGRVVQDGVISPSEEGGRWTDMKWMKGPEGFIHYKDGRVEAFDYA